MSFLLYMIDFFRHLKPVDIKMKLFWKHDSRLYEAMFYYNQDVRFLLCLQGTAWLDIGA